LADGEPAPRRRPADANARAVLSAPISGFDVEACKQYYARVRGVTDLLRDSWGFHDVYCAALSMDPTAPPDPPAVAMERLFREVDASSAMVLLWPTPLPTSALVEVGYALALSIPVLCFHQEAAPLPFLLTQDSRRLRRHAYRDHDHLETLIRTTRFADMCPEGRADLAVAKRSM
jgi:hypothetical protein